MVLNWLFFLFAFLNTSIHDSDKAYFTIIKQKEIILVKAEFPWTFRKALFEFKPELNDTKNQAAYNKAILEYIETNLKLYNSNNKPINLLEVKEVQLHQHSHQVNYEIVFKQETVTSISNYLMFNTNNSQENIHQLLNFGEKSSYTTTVDEPSFKINLN